MSAKKLNLATANARLIAEADMERVKAVKLELSKRKAGEVTPPRNTEPKTTKITQITVTDHRPTEAPKSAQSFHTSEPARKIVDQAPHLDFRGKGGGEPTKPKVAGSKARQAKLTKVSQPVQKDRVADDGSSKMFIPQWDKGSPSDIAYKVKAGVVSTDDRTPTVPKQKPANLHATTSPKGKRVSTEPREMLPQKHAKPQGKVSGFVSDPKDAPPRSREVKKGGKTKVENLVESGIEVRLGEKVKARFEIVSPAVLRKMVESYARHGLKLDVVRSTPNWVKDRTLLNYLWESMDAQYNGVPEHYENFRKHARNQFKQLVQGSYNSLYETRDAFLKVIDEAFKKVELNARKKYVESLELMTCKARVRTESGKADLEMVTEAHTDQMALRQVQNKLMEQYGLDIQIEHIFVDGTKYTPEQIEAWTPGLFEDDDSSDSKHNSGPGSDEWNSYQEKKRKKSDEASKALKRMQSRD